MGYASPSFLLPCIRKKLPVAGSYSIGLMVLQFAV